MNDDIHDLAGAYALDALDDIERARFESHLARCSACRRDVGDFRAAAARVGQSAAEEPPATMKANVLSAVREVRQVSALARPADRARRSRVLLLASAVAAAVVIAVLSIQVVTLRDDRREAQALAEVLAAPDAMLMEMHGDLGSGRLVWSPGLGRSVLVLDGLPQPGTDRGYQLWFVVGERQVPAGVYVPHDHRIVREAGDVPDGVRVIGITEEPATGSAAPTGPMLLTGEVPPAAT